MKFGTVHSSPSIVGVKHTRSRSSDEKGGHKTEGSTCEGPSPQDGLREWIRYGIAFESKCLECLADKSNLKQKAASMDNDKVANFDSRNFREKEKTVSCMETKKETKSASNYKENAAVAEKLDIRLPFCDWKKAFRAAKDAKGAETAVSDIAKGWLAVLAKLNCDDENFTSSTSFRSQIYRRLTLLLVGFVGTIGINSEEANRIVEKTSHLACKILKEEGSRMKKKLDDANTKDSLEEARRSIETDGISYYCLFTAIAAECGEFLGDLEKASLAYKSIRAMEQRDASIASRIYGSNIKGSAKSSSITVTKTPANTPTALARKTAGGRRSSFPKVMRFNDLANLALQSKIGKDLVLPGTLEERILRCEH
mmetsp:Transcript_6909/g.16862  ORF Transcript_6909/g.16862 Transcript_6909/m.16862 type:complete len:368 (-) Transcript_6909:2057-3160(-)